MTDQDHMESIACCTAVSGSDRRRTITVPPVPVTTLGDEPRRNYIVKPEDSCNSTSTTLMSSRCARPPMEGHSFTNGAQRRGASQSQVHEVCHGHGQLSSRHHRATLEQVPKYFDGVHERFGADADESDGELASQAAQRSSWSQGQGEGRGRSLHRRSAGESRRSNRDDSSLRSDGMRRMQSSVKGGGPVIGSYDSEAGADDEDAMVVVRQRGHLRADQPRRTGQHHQAPKDWNYEEFMDGAKQGSMVVDVFKSYKGQSSSDGQRQPLTQRLERRGSSDQLRQSTNFTKSGEIKKPSESKSREFHDDSSVGSGARDEAEARRLEHGVGFDHRRQESVPVHRKTGDERSTEWSSGDEPDTEEIGHWTSVQCQTSSTRRGQSSARCLERLDSTYDHHPDVEYGFNSSQRYRENRERWESDYLSDDETSSDQQPHRSDRHHLLEGFHGSMEDKEPNRKHGDSRREESQMQLQSKSGQPSECGLANRSLSPLEVVHTHSKSHIAHDTVIPEQSSETRQSSTVANNMLIVMCGAVWHWMNQLQQPSTNKEMQHQPSGINEPVHKPQQPEQLSTGRSQKMCYLKSCASLTEPTEQREQVLDEESMIAKQFDDLCNWPRISRRKQELLRDVASTVQPTKSLAGDCTSIRVEVDEDFDR